MRKIKFRGLTDEHVWVYGWFTDDDLSPDIIDGMSTRYKVLSKTVGQFTGLKESTGKEIYEGDILRDPDGRTLEVVWNNGAGSWECVRENYHFLFIMRYIDTMTVIGNVYDNPDLLEATE